MAAFFQKIVSAMGGRPAISDIDRGIIEAMIEIGADAKEIFETFGYSVETIEEVKATQSTSPYRIPPS
jgi:crotonobetainyl-CoA:carnitine CoA-transferase CaiB-like acyl-CoA transferase